jgi:hypothetical protein
VADGEVFVDRKEKQKSGEADGKIIIAEKLRG